MGYTGEAKWYPGASSRARRCQAAEETRGPQSGRECTAFAFASRGGDFNGTWRRQKNSRERHNRFANELTRHEQ
jgi:hypothetical protein